MINEAVVLWSKFLTRANMSDPMEVAGESETQLVSYDVSPNFVGSRAFEVPAAQSSRHDNLSDTSSMSVAPKSGSDIETSLIRLNFRVALLLGSAPATSPE